MVDDLGADPCLAAVQCVQAMGQRAFVLQNRLAAAYEPARNKVDARGRGAGQVHFVAIHTPGSDLRPGGGVVIPGQQVVYDSLVGQCSCAIK